VEGRGDAIGCKSFLVEVNGDVRHQWLPLKLNVHLRIIKGPRGGINHMPLDTAVLARCVGCLAEFDEVVLAGETLPAFNLANPRIVNTTRGYARSAGYRSGQNGFGSAIR